MRRRSPRIATLVEYRGNGILLTVARRLRSPNKQRTWQAEHWESQAWERDLMRVMRAPRMVLFDKIEIPATPVEVGKCRVVVLRLVPSRRNYIKDDDNLRFSVKALNDSLKRLHYIVADDRKHLEQPQVQQAVSDDASDWTQIYIEPIPLALQRRDQGGI